MVKAVLETIQNKPSYLYKEAAYLKQPTARDLAITGVEQPKQIKNHPTPMVG